MLFLPSLHGHVGEFTPVKGAHISFSLDLATIFLYDLLSYNHELRHYPFKRAYRKMKTIPKIVAVGIFFFLPSCLSLFWDKPTFTLKEIAVTRISSQEINLLFGIEVQNPNQFALKLRALEYAVYFNDQEVGKGQLEKEVEIAPLSSTLVQVPLQADFKSLGNLLGAVIFSQNIPYKIEGAAIIKTSLGSATVPFAKSGEIKIKK